MTEPHKRPYRHPKYKTAYRINNGREYEQSLRDRGDVTRWISQDAIDAWTPPQSTAPTQRDQYLLAIERIGRFQWKRTSGYYDQADAENAFSRFKRTFGTGRRAKRDASQERRLLLPASC
jgi:hypothetical protein